MRHYSEQDQLGSQLMKIRILFKMKSFLKMLTKAYSLSVDLIEEMLRLDSRQSVLIIVKLSIKEIKDGLSMKTRRIDYLQMVPLYS
jgi:hypothetical protein